MSRHVKAFFFLIFVLARHRLHDFVEFLRARLLPLGEDHPEYGVWKSAYVRDNLARGLGGYCWHWLESGYCRKAMLGIPCHYLHAYPPFWSDAQRMEHRARQRGYEGSLPDEDSA